MTTIDTVLYRIVKNQEIIDYSIDKIGNKYLYISSNKNREKFKIISTDRPGVYKEVTQYAAIIFYTKQALDFTLKLQKSQKIFAKLEHPKEWDYTEERLNIFLTGLNEILNIWNNINEY